MAGELLRLLRARNRVRLRPQPHRIPGCSLLTGRGVPCSGEGDLKNCQAMAIMDLLGCGGSFTEFYAMESVIIGIAACPHAARRLLLCLLMS